MLPRNFDHACFISFAQADKVRPEDAPFFTDFLDKINTALTRGAHHKPGKDAYFLINKKDSGDFQKDLQIGGARSVCVLSMYSPHYWSSKACAMEREYFLTRNLQSSFNLPDATDHVEMFAVPWIHLASDLQGHFAEKVIPHDATDEERALTYFRREEQFSHVYQLGLLAAMKSPDGAIRQEATEYINALASKIAAVVQTFHNACPSPARVAKRGALYVLAADPFEVDEKISALMKQDTVRAYMRGLEADCCQLRVNAYKIGGGADWKPFLETKAVSVGSIVEDVLQADLLEIKKKDIPLQPLLEMIDAAEQRREYVIVIVDPWSLFHFPRLRRALAGLDQKQFRNCMLLVVRAPADRIYELHQDQIEAELERLFAVTRVGSSFFREVTTDEQLRDAIRQIFTRLRSLLASERIRKVDTSGPSELLRFQT
jgi:FxsC-like protein